MRIRIAGLAVDVDFAEDSTAARLAPVYEAFLAPEAEALLHLRLHEDPTCEGLPFVPGPWQLDLAWNGQRLHYRSHGEVGWIDFETARGQATINPRSSGENYLRVAVGNLLPLYDKLLVHAAGVLRRGAAYVFFGPSNSGKTTVTSLLDDGLVLSDDLVAVGFEGDRLFAYGVPFRGDLPEAPRTNATGPLAGLYTLQHAAAPALAPLPKPIAVGRLTAVLPFIQSDPKRLATAVHLAARIVEAQPVQQLSFAIEPSFWKKIDG